MGMHMSFIGGKGLSKSQMLSLVTNSLYNRFVEKDVKDFDGFQIAILDIFNIINMALPGKHYDVPSYKEVKDLFKQWNKAKREVCRRNIFTDFMMMNVNLNKVDESMIITAIVAPPAAMVAKRTGQTVPQLKLMKAIPDVVFVPAATVLALIAVKILRTKIFVEKIASRDDANGPQVMDDHVVQDSNSIDTSPPHPSAEPTKESDSSNNVPPHQPVQPLADSNSDNIQLPSHDHVVQDSNSIDIPPPQRAEAAIELDSDKIPPPSHDPQPAPAPAQPHEDSGTESKKEKIYCIFCKKYH